MRPCKRDADTTGPQAAVLPITGYLDRLSARPGERLAVKVSAQGASDYEAEVLRIRCADPNPDGPGLRFVPQDFGLRRRHPARRQDIDLGSYGTVPAHPVFSGRCRSVSLRLQPWLLRSRPSTLVAFRDAAGGGWSLGAGRAGLTLDYTAADGTRARLELPARLRRRRWYALQAGFDAAAGRLEIRCRRLAPPGGTDLEPKQELHAQTSAALSPLPEALALRLAADGAPTGLSTAHFNGRLEDVALFAGLPSGAPELPDPAGGRAPDLLAWWDFSLGIETQAIVDRGPWALHGRLVNVPTRAVRGACWDGTAMSWQAAPRHYAAIHFHEDDLYDCGWATDFELEIPAGTRSGVYGLRLRQDGQEDILPFYVLPPKGGTTAKVCFLAPTFTYQAYANHARGNCDEAMRRRMAEWGAFPYNPDDFPIYGGSTYDFHPDGTGTCFASRLRPTLTIRPGFLTFTDPRGSGLRHFPADSHLTDWLEARGIDFDVVTDEALDDEGPELIAEYAVVLTGSHPEYHTSGTLDALAAYGATGGNLVYLGGNGFYWRIARAAALPGMIEVRRAEGGIRAWAAEPGESYHALDGRYGGLWRRNGRPPQDLVGIGFSAQGLFEGSYYTRLPAARRPEVAWIFEGVEEDRLGDYGLSGGGAAGFELDRADVELGTPDDAVVLARSQGHGESFVMVPEEVLSHLATTPGESPEALVRGEIVYFERPNGGAVLSVGSICFCGSLSHKNYENGVSRLLENVVRRFADRPTPALRTAALAEQV